jgi:hypothetical protein
MTRNMVSFRASGNPDWQTNQKSNHATPKGNTCSFVSVLYFCVFLLGVRASGANNKHSANTFGHSFVQRESEKRGRYKRIVT